MKKNNHKWLQGIAGILLGTTLSTFSVGAEIDLSIEQEARPRAEFSDIRANEVKDAKFVKDGYFTVGMTTSSTLPLHDFAIDAKTIIGFDMDFALAIADSMGKELDVISIAWADWPLGLSSGKFDAVISNVTVTEDRKKKYDFATYRKDDIGIYVSKNSAITEVKEPKDVAGLKVITDSGTNQEKILLEWDRLNVEAGLEPIEVQYYEDKGLQVIAIESGRADAIFGVNSLHAYLSATTNKTKHVGTVNGGWPLTAEIAVAFPKGSELVEPVSNIINDFVESGLYLEILERWALETEAVEESVINPPGLP
ncbi:ABC transporter substrate-binding protein [Ignatzschineria sp. LJL83]